MEAYCPLVHQYFIFILELMSLDDTECVLTPLLSTSTNSPSPPREPTPQSSPVVCMTNDASDHPSYSFHARRHHVTFGSAHEFYFHRAQGFQCVPSQGGATLGMQRCHHADLRLPVAVHEACRSLRRRVNLYEQCVTHKLVLPSSQAMQLKDSLQRLGLLPEGSADCWHYFSSYGAPSLMHGSASLMLKEHLLSIKKRMEKLLSTVAVISKAFQTQQEEASPMDLLQEPLLQTLVSEMQSATEEPIYFMQTIGVRQRRKMLNEAGIDLIDHSERDECHALRISRQSCGCTCPNGTCRPDTCACSVLGVSCQVDRVQFPCRCGIPQLCSNPEGRTEFNATRVHAHYLHTKRHLAQWVRENTMPMAGESGDNDTFIEQVELEDTLTPDSQPPSTCELNSTETGRCRMCEQMRLGSFSEVPIGLEDVPQWQGLAYPSQTSFLHPEDFITSSEHSSMASQQEDNGLIETTTIHEAIEDSPDLSNPTIPSTNIPCICESLPPTNPVTSMTSVDASPPMPPLSPPVICTRVAVWMPNIIRSEDLSLDISMPMFVSQESVEGTFSSSDLSEDPQDGTSTTSESELPSSMSPSSAYFLPSSVETPELPPPACCERNGGGLICCCQRRRSTSSILVPSQPTEETPEGSSTSSQTEAPPQDADMFFAASFPAPVNPGDTPILVQEDTVASEHELPRRRYHLRRWRSPATAALPPTEGTLLLRTPSFLALQSRKRSSLRTSPVKTGRRSRWPGKQLRCSLAPRALLVTSPEYSEQGCHSAVATGGTDLLDRARLDTQSTPMAGATSHSGSTDLPSDAQNN